MKLGERERQSQLQLSEIVIALSGYVEYPRKVQQGYTSLGGEVGNFWFGKSGSSEPSED